MSLVKSSDSPSLRLKLARNLVRSIKRGHAWIYREALRALPEASHGTPAILLDNRSSRPIARGFYDPNSAIAFRICTTHPEEELTDFWAADRMGRAVRLRQDLFSGRFEKTSGYRLFNGEGDGLPGMVCDVYGTHAVLRYDGHAARCFWQPEGVAKWLLAEAGVNSVYERIRSKDKIDGCVLVGNITANPVLFMENGLHFTADLVNGQKTGFYLDQRDNRYRIRQVSRGRSVLDLFGYTGGFAINTGHAGAKRVTTVDQARPALHAAEAHWQMNDLPHDHYTTIQNDVFAYLNEAVANGDIWDLVIIDPPSFAPSEESVKSASLAYRKLITAGVNVTDSNGMIAASSCSSHIRQDVFLDLCQQSISDARRKGTILGIYGLPPDHPTPLLMPELRYLKFIIFRVD